MAKKVKEEMFNLVGRRVSIRMSCPVSVIGIVEIDAGEYLIVRDKNIGQIFVPSDKILVIYLDVPDVQTQPTTPEGNQYGS
ncbi:MAG: hypothetical protein LUO93_10490 [Methanomicrobiales archaeon]|nr:hypothetical protein [Methanomicrobiales archaeon]